MSFISYVLILLSSINSNTISNEHTLKFPFDSKFNANNWVYGGSTVLTQNFARFTPKETKNIGWIKSNTVLPNGNSELVFTIKVDSGRDLGNGMIFYFIYADGKDEDIIYQTNYYEQDLNGMKLDKKGFYVMIKRLKINEKHSIFVIDNTDGKMKDKLNDYQKQMAGKSSNKNKCFIDLDRNKEKFKLKMKKSNKSLYLYTITKENGSFKPNFCLDIIFKQSVITPTYLSISAVNSNKEFYEIHTVSMLYKENKNKTSIQKKEDILKFLKKERKTIQRKNSTRSGYKTKFRRVFSLGVVISSIFLFLETVWEISLLNNIAVDKTDPSKTLEVINGIIPFTIYIQMILFILQLVTFHFQGVLLLSLITFQRIYKIAIKSYLLRNNDYDFSSKGNRYNFWLYLSSVIYVLFIIVAVEKLLSF